jgi:hypothetical protein
MQGTHVIVLRHGQAIPLGSPQQLRNPELSLVGLVMMQMTGSLVGSALKSPIKHIVSSESPRATGSRDAFYSGAMLAHRDWEKPRRETFVTLQPWDNHELTIVRTGLAAARKVRIDRGYESFTEAVLNTPECNHAIRQTRADYEKVLQNMFEWGPGLYVIIAHEPQATLLALSVAGLKPTVDNAKELLGSQFLRPGEGWSGMWTPEKKIPIVQPIRRFGSISAAMPHLEEETQRLMLALTQQREKAEQS